MLHRVQEIVPAKGRLDDVAFELRRSIRKIQDSLKYT